MREGVYILVYTMLLYRVVDALARGKVPYALAGGYAVALHGAVRGTVDVDLVLRLSRSDFVRADAAFRAIGLTCRLPVSAREVFDFREEYLRNRNLVAWSFYNAAKPIEVVDVLLTHDLRKLKTETLRIHGRSIRIVSVADLIRMKRESGRPQDLADIDALRRLAKR